MEKEISELYRLFKKYKLAPDFASRCSPYGERREVAKYLEHKSLHHIEMEVVDYCLKAIYTMGDEQDLKYFLPRLIESMVIDHSLVNSWSLFKKLKMSGFEQWETVEQKLIYKICEQHFILKLNGQSDGMLSSMLDDYVELFDL